jgi:NADH-quinone oxidoreductase subunit J
MTLLAQAAEVAAGATTSETVLFWVFGVLALGSALAVITMRNIVHGALMLVLNLLAIAGLYLTLESSFLGIIQVLVYAGAIMVLFLFVIMLLGVQRDDLLRETEVRSRVAAVVGGALLAGALLFAFVGPYTTEASVCGPAGAEAAAAGAEGVRCRGLAGAYADGDDSGVAFLGLRMFTRYTFAFELSALLLTVATIGAVILARRKDLAPEDEDLHPDGPGPGDPAAASADIAEQGSPVLVGADRGSQDPVRASASDPASSADPASEHGGAPASGGDASVDPATDDHGIDASAAHGDDTTPDPDGDAPTEVDDPRREG